MKYQIDGKPVPRREYIRNKRKPVEEVLDDTPEEPEVPDESEIRPLPEGE